MGRCRRRPGRTGPLDPTVANSVSNDVSTLVHDACQSFDERTEYAVEREPNAIAVRDIDGDCDLDLAIASPHRVSVLINNGRGVFSDGFVYTIGNAESIGLGDVDGDGDTDVVVAGGSTLSILLDPTYAVIVTA